MTARQLFHKGDHVRSKEKTWLTGVVVGYGNRPWLIRVLHDGRCTAETWHMSVWETMTLETYLRQTIATLEAERDTWRARAERAQWEDVSTSTAKE